MIDCDQQQEQLLEQLAQIVSVIDRIRAGLATNNDADFLESYLALPNTLRKGTEHEHQRNQTI